MHPSDADIADYCLGSGPEDFLLQVDQHVIECSRCARKVVAFLHEVHGARAAGSKMRGSDREYGIGNPLVDDEHRHLHGILTRVSEAAVNEQWQSVDLLLEYLHRFLEVHFATEEQSLFERSLPDVFAHMAEHARLLARVRSHIDDARAPGNIDLKRLIVLVSSLEEHTIIWDDEMPQAGATSPQ